MVLILNTLIPKNDYRFVLSRLEIDLELKMLFSFNMDNTVTSKLDNLGHISPYATRLPPEGGLYGLPPLPPIVTRKFLFRVFQDALSNREQGVAENSESQR
ncbi:MAG: hypothetical protein ACFFD2_20295 [Promethearchaeota archaeon]